MVDSSALHRMATDPAYFRSQLVIEVAGKPVRYASVAADWKELDFQAMDPAWMRCAGLLDNGVQKMRAMLERCRGASKTADLAIMGCWALAFAVFAIRLISCSGDRDQAKLLRDAIRRLATLNPWLGQTLQIQQWTIRNERNGGELEVLSADSSTAFGQLADAILIDELHNWPDTDSAKNFWTVVASTLAKKANCLAVAISNAGRLDSWQWKVREAIREDENWHFHSLAVVPDWIKPQLAEQRKLLAPSEYERLFENNWTVGVDDGLPASDVMASCVLNGPQGRRLPEYDAYICSVDLGWKHDRSAAAVLALNFERREIALAFAVDWLPADFGGELPLEIVEQAILYVHRRFDLEQLVFDPRESTGTAQQLIRQGVPCHKINLSPAVQHDMAKRLLEGFNQRTIKLYNHPALVRDLLSLRVADRAIGLKLEAARTSAGHADLGFCFAIGVYAASCIFDDYARGLFCHQPEEIWIA